MYQLVSVTPDSTFFHDRQHGLLGLPGANTMNSPPGYARFLLFLIGDFCGAWSWARSNCGFHAGKFGGRRLSFLADLRGADTGPLYALLGGLFSTWQTCSWWRLSKSRPGGGLADRHRIGARRGR